MHQFDDPAVLTEENVFVSEKWLRLSEIIQDIWPDVSLRWIPPHRRGDIDRSRPYAIVHSPSDRAPYVIFFASETDNPEEILGRLFAGDTSKQNVLKNIEAYDDARKMFELKKQREIAERAADLAAWMAGTPLNYIRFHDKNGKLKKIDKTRRNGGQL